MASSNSVKGGADDICAQHRLHLADPGCEAQRMRLAASVFSFIQEGIIITGARHGSVDVTPAFTRITGHERDDVCGKTPALLNSLRHADKCMYWAKQSGNNRCHVYDPALDTHGSTRLKGRQ